MKYKITHATRYRYSDAVPISHNLVHLAPRETFRQSCFNYRLLIHPTPAFRSHRTDCYGNRVEHFAIQHAHHGLTVTATSFVDVRPVGPDPGSGSPAWEAVVEEMRHDRSSAGLSRFEFVFDSTVIRASRELAQYARTSFTPGRPVLEAARDLTHRIHTEFQYDSKATNVSTPIETVLSNRRGVCQDFAQVEVGCLRSIGIPARYVSGYLRTEPPAGQPRLIGVDASHAWVSIYCGPLGWIDWDPTNDLMVSTDHITVAWGRDYVDVSPVQGTFLGGGQHTMSTSVDVVPIVA